MRARLVALVIAVVGCGAAPASTEPTTGPAPRETPACHDEREAILADIAQSAARACRADSDCTTVTNPGSFERELVLVAHVEDAPSLEARAETHLDQCGAFIHHEAIDAVDVVSAECHASCEARVTTLHIE